MNLPRHDVPEVHAPKSDAHVSPDWPEHSNKTKQNKVATATATNTETGTQNEGKPG